MPFSPPGIAYIHHWHTRDKIYHVAAGLRQIYPMLELQLAITHYNNNCKEGMLQPKANIYAKTTTILMLPGESYPHCHHNKNEHTRQKVVHHCD